MARDLSPKEITAVVRNQTFAVESWLVKAGKDSFTDPLRIYDKQFSRYKFILIGANKASVYANVPIKDIAGIIETSKFLYSENLRKLIKGNKNLPNSPAYTTKISAGKFKGLTPAEVISENPDNAKELNEHYKWLNENLAKYPKNKTIMDAILDAGRLSKEGKLVKVEGTSKVPIYEPSCKPLIRKKREDGKSFVYEIKIYWCFGMDYPLEVSIENYYAPVLQADSGMLNVKVSEKADSKKVTMNLSATEWIDTIYSIERNMSLFEMFNGKSCFDESQKLEAEQSFRTI